MGLDDNRQEVEARIENPRLWRKDNPLTLSLVSHRSVFGVQSYLWAYCQGSKPGTAGSGFLRMNGFLATVVWICREKHECSIYRRNRDMKQKQTVDIWLMDITYNCEDLVQHSFDGDGHGGG